MRVEMGTTLAIEAQAATTAQAAAAVSAAFEAASAAARRFDPHNPESDMARINAAPPGTAVTLGTDTMALLRFAQRLQRASRGLFDPCLPTRPGTLADLELFADELPCAVAHRKLEVDCGGIAKGYVVDVAIAALQRGHCSSGLVNAGGDLRAFGACGAMLLRTSTGRYRPVWLGEAALAVSERASARSPSGHRGYYVRAGRAGRRRYAAVRAATAMAADALSKCVLLGTDTLAGELLREFGGERLA